MSGNLILKTFLIFSFLILVIVSSSKAMIQHEDTNAGKILLYDRPEQVRVTVTEGIVRSGAGTNHPVIITVSYETILLVIEKEGKWFRVRLTPELGTEADYGYIHESIVELIEKEQLTTIGEVENDVEQLRVIMVSANIREGAGVDKNVMTTVPAGTILEILERKGSWFKVKLNNNIVDHVDHGYIHDSAVEIREHEFISVQQSQNKPEQYDHDMPKRFGVGLTTWLTYQWLPMPTVYYDAGEKMTMKGTIGSTSGVTILNGELVYRWQLSSSSGSNVRFEPFIGGSFVLFSGEMEHGSFSGVVPFVSGGVFMYLNNHPEWRFQGTVNTILVGTLISVSAAYYF